MFLSAVKHTNHDMEKNISRYRVKKLDLPNLHCKLKVMDSWMEIWPEVYRYFYSAFESKYLEVYVDCTKISDKE